MRELVQKYGMYAVGAILLIAVVYGFIATRSGNVRGTQMAFYIDEETGQEVVRPMEQNPPLLNDAGKPTLVRVVKFSCDGGKTVNTAYYEKYTDEAKKVLDQKNDPRATEYAYRGLLVRAPDKGSPWVPQTSSAGQEILRRASCDDPSKLLIVGPPPQ